MQTPKTAQVHRDLRIFWLGLAIILVLSAIPRLLSYDFSLPYVEHVDEPRYYLQSIEPLGLYDMDGYFNGYPPGYLVLSDVVRRLVDPNGWYGAGETVRALRLISVIANLVTLIFIGLAARAAANNLAGWLAAAGWGVSPHILRIGVYAIQDPMVYMWVSIALWFAAVAITDDERRHWSVWSFIAGILAVVFKYPAWPALIPGAVVALTYFIKDRRANRYPLAMEAVLSVPLGIWLFSQLRLMSDHHRETVATLSGGFENLWQPGIVLHNLYFSFVPLNAPVVLSVIGLAILAMILTRSFRRSRKAWAVMGLSAVMLGTSWFISMYSEVSLESRLRDVVPATVGICIILGIAIIQIIDALPKRWKALPVVVPVLFAGTVFGPQYAASWQLAIERAPRDRRVELRQWADVNLEPGLIVVTDENHKVFNPYWGGMTGKWFDWLRTERISDQPYEYWVDRQGAVYAIIPTWEIDQMEQTAEGRAYLSRMLHLRDFVEPPGLRGPEMAVYRFRRMQHETNLRFGDEIVLHGYDISSLDAAPGSTVDLRFYWSAEAVPSTNYSLFVHLMPLDAVELLSQVDGNPAVPERLTMTWDQPSETLISPWFQLAIPDDLPPGEYRVFVGLYDPQTGERLLITDGDGGSELGDAVDVVHLTVTP